MNTLSTVSGRLNATGIEPQLKWLLACQRAETYGSQLCDGRVFIGETTALCIRSTLVGCVYWSFHAEAR